MSLIRTHKAAGDFFLAHKHWAQDETLSWAARGILSYLFSQYDGWEIRVTDLDKKNPDGKYHRKSVMKELEEKGYVIREKIRDDDGTFTWTSEVFEVPPKLQEATKNGDSSELNQGGFLHHGENPPWIESTVDKPGAIITSTSNNNDSPVDSADADPSESNGETKGDELRYTSDDWQLKAATWVMEELEKTGSLHPSVLRNKDHAKVLDQWANEVNLMESDGMSRKEIGQCLKWLFEEDDWWVSTGNFASLGNVRTKKSSGGERKWDTIVHKFRKTTTKAPKRAVYAKDVNMEERRSRDFV